MAEEKAKTTLEKIESLIVDGNKEVVEQLREELGGKIDRVERNLRQELGGKIDRLDKKVDRLDKKVDVNAQAAHDLLTDVQNDLKAHLRVPHAV